MEYFDIFYKIFNADSPIYDHEDTYKEQLIYLKRRYPKYIRHHKIQLRKTEKGRFQVVDHLQFAFEELSTTFFSDSSKVLIYDDLPEASQSALKQLLGRGSDHIVDIRLKKKPDSILYEIITSEDYQSISGQEIRFYFYQVSLHEAVNEIKGQLHQKVFDLKNEEAIKVHVKKYQAVINAYIHVINNERIPAKKHNGLYQISANKTDMDIHKLAFQKLEDILIYMEKTFFNYLDLSFPIPYCNRLWLLANYSDASKALIEKLDKTKSLPKNLLNLLKKPLENLVIHQAREFSYYDQLYHIEYIDALDVFLKQHHRLSEFAAMYFLKTYDFNDHDFFLYVTRRIADEMKSKKTVSEKLKTLYFYEKTLKESPVKATFGYNQEHLPFKDQMSLWFIENIQFYRRKLKFEPALSVGSFSEPLSELYKKQLVLISVSEMSLFTRLFYENKLLEGTRKSVLQFVSNSYSTLKTKNISIESLDRKYYELPTTTKRNVRQVLRNMLDQLDKFGK
ncbi:hypothetical protein J8281_03490 [Aquimarina sp. U1-2]|uniref:hypothetical protein n=1 Tax=Aquimarina sp. U1-2 TaxID=2823141 RepID=UPI001AECB46A|nr:hypothetical protein [Aquimarina sp. U1-2]MBP2831241.1 hypothetical protein [Aquimarina sp. U1-2]